MTTQISTWLSQKENELSEMSNDELLVELDETVEARETLCTTFSDNEEEEKAKAEARVKAWEDLIFAEIHKRNIKRCPCMNGIVFIDNMCADCYWEDDYRQKHKSMTEYLKAFSIVK
jgi:hypothetical protein